MAWPSKIYVATTTLGVYYTDDFVDPSTQPTWTAINDGLPTTDCYQFNLDPFHQADRQYVILQTDHTLYRRENGGAWAEILTPTDLVALAGGGNSAEVRGVWPDPSIDGRLWASALVVDVVAYTVDYYAVYSNDYGDTWTALLFFRSGQAYGLDSIRAFGSNVWVWASTRDNSWTGVRFYNSGDLGLNWYDGQKLSSSPAGAVNPLLPTWIYGHHTPDEGGHYLAKLPIGVTWTNLQSGIYPERWDCMWFNDADSNHQRLLFDYKLYVTDDDWATINSPSAITPSPYSIAPWAGADTDQMLVGLNIDHNQSKDHIVGALYGEADTSATGIAGANCSGPPYTDSIPYTAAAVCTCGLQAVEPAIGSVYTHAVAMPGYDGDDRGIPIQGDRSAWEASNYPSRHADDVDEVTGIHHTLGTDPGQASPGDHTHALDDLSDVDAAAPNDDDMLVWDDTAGNWVPVAFVLPDHDHSGDAGDGNTFDAANLTSGASGDGQVLTSDGAGESAWEDLPALANHDHSGDAGDGGTFDAANLTAGASTDGQVLTSDGAGGSAWEDAAGGADPNAIHDNAANEISAIAEKATPVNADLVLIEDSEAGYVKKKVQMVNLPGGASVFTDLTDVPASYAVGDGGKLVRVKVSEDGLEFIAPPAGTGDVVGPAGATDGHLAVFDGATGKLIKDGGAPAGGSGAGVLEVQVFS